MSDEVERIEAYKGKDGTIYEDEKECRLANIKYEYLRLIENFICHLTSDVCSDGTISRKLLHERLATSLWDKRDFFVSTGAGVAELVEDYYKVYSS